MQRILLLRDTPLVKQIVINRRKQKRDRRMTTPTVGRIVHYTEETKGDIVPDQHAAIITAVWSDTCVNLTIFHPDGHTYSKTSVVQSADQECDSWDWPPRV